MSFSAEDEVESRTRIFQTVLIFIETSISNLCEDSRNAFWLILELDNSYIRYRINCGDSRWIGEIISFGNHAVRNLASSILVPLAVLVVVFK